MGLCESPIVEYRQVSNELCRVTHYVNYSRRPLAFPLCPARCPSADRARPCEGSRQGGRERRRVRSLEEIHGCKTEERERERERERD